MHVNNQKDTNLKSISNKIELEELNEQKLNEQLNEYKNEIAKYKKLIKELQNQDKERNYIIMQETTEMKRFISDL